MRNIVILLFLICFQFSSIAQDRKTFNPKFVLKSNPLALVLRTLEISADIKSGDHKSIQITTQIIDNRTVLDFNEFHDDIETITGWGIAFEKRNYSKKRVALQGLYYGPYVKIQALRSTIGNVLDYIRLSRISTSIGLTGGMQLVHRYVFPTIDINLGLGLCYSSYPKVEDLSIKTKIIPEFRFGVNFGLGI